MATLSDYKPTLHNDVSIDDESIYEQHTKLINNKNYSDAVVLLSNNTQISGCTASLLNSWEKKIQDLEGIIEQKEFYDPYFNSSTEPSTDDMTDKVIWQQEY